MISQKRLLLAILIIIIAISLAGWIVLLRGFKTEPNGNTNALNINISNINTTTNNVNGQQLNVNNQPIDTTDWQTYRNEELGVQFKHPMEFGTVVVIKKTKENNPAVLGGEGVYITFTDNKGVNIIISTRDYNEFKTYYYVGDEDLINGCVNEFKLIDGYICRKIKVANQGTYESINMISDESMTNLMRSVRLNSGGEKYSGIIIRQSWEKIRNDLSEREDISSDDEIIKNYLENILRNEKLDLELIKQNYIFNEFLESFELLRS